MNLVDKNLTSGLSVPVEFVQITVMVLTLSLYNVNLKECAE